MYGGILIRWTGIGFVVDNEVTIEVIVKIPEYLAIQKNP